ncbi:MAG: pentapeptide repeat-containing protein [Planctomycetota bacterium]|nr:pentapeptide repeat-containing protein [Planctomycetota bacterium]
MDKHGDLIARCRALLEAGDVAEFNRIRPAGSLDLTGLSVSKKNLRGVNLDDAVLARAALIQCDLTGATFRRALLDRSDLSKAKLQGATFSRESRLRYACLSEVQAQGANFEAADLTRADLTKANLSDARLSYTVLVDATLSGAVLDRAELFKAYMLGATIEDTSFKNAQLQEAMLRQAKGMNPDFSGANLTNADALRAILHGDKLSFAGAYVKGLQHDGLEKHLANAIADRIPDAAAFAQRRLPIDPAMLVDGIPNSNRGVYEAALRDLNELVGLADVKAFVRRLGDVMRVQNARSNAGLPPLDFNLHFVFTGSPGTGKTTVARIVSQILHGVGYLSKGHLEETDRAGLVAGFLGQTAIKTAEAIDRAKGGTLLIDEAYALTANDDQYGGEAIATLLKRMEDRRGTFTVIAAGYTREMHDFIGSNPGLKSRFTKFVHFPDYADSELVDIMGRMLGNKRLTCTPAMLGYSSVLLAVQKRAHGAEFANGRTVRNYVQEMVERQASRLVADSEHRLFVTEAAALARGGAPGGSTTAALAERIERETRRLEDRGESPAVDLGKLRELALRPDAGSPNSRSHGELVSALDGEAARMGGRGDLADVTTLSLLDTQDIPFDTIVEGGPGAVDLGRFSWESRQHGATSAVPVAQLALGDSFPSLSPPSTALLDQLVAHARPVLPAR